MEAINHKTLCIWLREPNVLFLRLLSSVPTSIIPADLALGDESDFWAMPSGTGPFRITQMNEGLCVLEAFDAHFQGRPHLDRVEVLILPELEAGSLKEPDWNSVMSSQGDASKVHFELPSYEEGGDWHREESLFACSSLLVFNQWVTGPQNDPLFRQALHQIIDRERLIAELGQDRIYPARGFRSNAVQESEAAAQETCMTEDEIRELLEASCYRGETFRILANQFHQDDAVWIEQQLQPYGINVSIRISDQFDPTDTGGLAYHGRLFGATLETDEVGELGVYLQKGYFFTAYTNEMAAKVCAIANAVFREADSQKRKRLMKDLENLIRSEYAVLFLAHKKNSTSFHKSVRGVNINKFGLLDFDKIWFAS